MASLCSAKLPVRKVDSERHRFKAPQVKTIFAFDKLLIARGSTGFGGLKLPGADRSRIFYLRQRKIRKASRRSSKRGKRALA